MNIVMVTPTYPPTQGGVQTQVNLLAETLNKRGHKITIITERVEDALDVEIVEGITIFRLPPPLVKLDPWRSYFFIRKNINTIKTILKEEKADVIHIHHANRSFAYAYLLKKHFTTPIVSTIHVSWLGNPLYREWRMDIKEPIRRALKLLPGLWFDKQSIISADFVIAISKHFEKVCKEIRGDGRVTTIPNAIDLNQFNPDVQTSSNILNTDGYNILCSGRLSPEKGQIYLVRALKTIDNFKNFHVFFMGASEPKEKKKIEILASKLKLKNYVHFIPPVPYDQVPQVYNNADLIVVPSTSESSGLVILENMALGNVVVASNVGGVPELIEDGITGLLVPPKNPNALAETIIKALEDWELRNKIKTNAIKRAMDFDIEKTVGKIEEVYTEVSNG